MTGSDKGVVLDRTGLIQLVAGVALLTVLGFTTGAVVGFAARGAVELPAVASASGSSGAARRAASTRSRVAVDSTRSMAVAEAPDSTASSSAPARPQADSVTRRSDPVASGATVDRRPEKLGSGYAVQVGVFSVPRNADRLAHHLRRRGYDPLVVAMRNRAGHWMKWVDLSVFPTRDAARSAAASFRAREGLPAVVVVFREPGQ